MRVSSPPKVELPAPFPPAFRALLPALLSTRGPLDAGRVERLRARRAMALSQSGTFVGHRPYERGDDLRHLDWAAYARTGELFTKQLQEEDRRAVTVVLDLSRSLTAGGPPRRVGMLRLAAVIAGLALARLDGVAVVAPGAGGAASARFSGVAQLPLLLQHLATLPWTDDALPDEAVQRTLQGDAIGRVHWISDFAPAGAFARPLAALRRRGARLTGWLPAVPEDEAPRPGGYVRVVDPETLEALDVPVDARLSAELRRQLDRLAQAQRRMFAEVGSPLLRWEFAGAPLDAPRLRDHLPIVAACAR